MADKKYMYTAAFACIIAINAQAFCAIPVWTFSAPMPAMVNISNESIASVQYTVTNQSSRAKNLQLKPTLGLSASNCVLAGKGVTGRATTPTY